MQITGYAPHRMAFALAGGLLALALCTRPAAGQEKAAAKASEVEYEGWRQYMVNCARCHGDDAVGGVMAPDLRGSLARGGLNEASFAATVSDGRTDKGMPPFKEVLTEEQIAAITAYVSARAKGKLPAGRPTTS